MKIEDRTSEKKRFDSLKVGDVFRYGDNDGFYMKIIPIYPVDEPIDDLDEIEYYITSSPASNAYNLLSHRYVTIGNDEEVQVVEATLVVR